MSRSNFRYKGQGPRQVAAGAGRPTGALGRPCSKCGAAIGHSCRRLRGPEAGERIESFHDDRKRASGGAS